MLAGGDREPGRPSGRRAGSRDAPGITMRATATPFYSFTTRHPGRPQGWHGSSLNSPKAGVQWDRMPNRQSLSDEELVVRSQRESDPTRKRFFIGELFDRYQRNVALWCYRFTGDREAGADLAQEVFLKVFKKLDSFRCDASFSTWLYSVCRNHCLNFLKTSRRRPIQVEPELLADVNDETGQRLLQKVENESAHRFIRELMARELTETEITVMVLHYGEEVPLSAVTRMLGLDNASGAKAFIVSAKRKLQRALQRHEARMERRREDSSSSACNPSREKR